MSQDEQGRAQNLATISDANTSGKQGFLHSAFQVGGELVGAATDPIVEGVKAATPGIVKPLFSQLAAPVVSGVKTGVKKISDLISNIPAVQRFSQTPAAASLERDTKAVNEYASILPGGEGAPIVAKGVAKGAAKVATGVVDAGAATAAKVGKVADKAAAPFADTYKPGLAEAFRSEGIVPPVSAVTDSPFVRGAEGLAAKSAFGAPILDQIQIASKAIEDKTNAVIEKIKPAKSVSDENLGKTIQEGLREYEHNFKATEDGVYTSFAKTYGKAETYPANTLQMLAEVVGQQGKDFFRGVDPRLASMYDRLSGESPTTKQMRAQGLPEDVIDKQRAADAPKLSFDELKATRTSIGEQITRDPENTALKRIYGAISQDLKKAVGDVDKKGGAALQKLDADYKSGKKMIEGRISQSIEQSNPERIAQNLITRNSADTLKTVKEMIGEQRFAEVSKTFLRQTFEKAVTRGELDVEKLKKVLSGYDHDTLEQVLSREQIADLNGAITKLEKLGDLKKAMKSGQKMSEGSPTAYLNRIAMQGGRVVGLATALASLNVPLAAGILMELGGEYVGSKLFTSPVGRKLLTTGVGGKKSIGTFLKSPPKQGFIRPLPKKPSVPPSGPDPFPDQPPF